MKRVGFYFRVRADKMDLYKEHHKNVWPEMKEALTRNGWHNYTLFIRPDGLVFGYFETPTDLATAVAAMGKEDVNERWQAFMQEFVPSDLAADESMVELEEYFHLD
ncbi:MAG: L-rhamnose mutarotase [Anaerolineaceae bacterium]|nr:L-rhamnose mutarotase [Anaerolineaceae bacterium]